MAQLLRSKAEQHEVKSMGMILKVEVVGGVMIMVIQKDEKRCLLLLL